MDLNKDSTELLNILTYHNYGLLSNADSIDLSQTNRLALCTDKAIFILNYNFEWPSIINNSSPFKFFFNNSKQTTNSQKQPVQFETWLQDLAETKNESFYVNIIRSVQKSNLFSNLFNSFFQLKISYMQTNKKAFTNN